MLAVTVVGSLAKLLATTCSNWDDLDASLWRWLFKTDSLQVSSESGPSWLELGGAGEQPESSMAWRARSSSRRLWEERLLAEEILTRLVLRIPGKHEKHCEERFTR